jgi:hypothetical protein
MQLCNRQQALFAVHGQALFRRRLGLADQRS